MFIKNFISGKLCLTLGNYSKDSKFYDNTNKKVMGKMKDEYGGVIIDEVVGLKSKMYSMKKIDGKESSTAKGVNIATEFNEFKDVPFNKKTIRHKMKRIQAKKHKVGTYEIDKISLSCFDDKRFVLVMEFILYLILIKIVIKNVIKMKIKIIIIMIIIIIIMIINENDK